MIDLIINLLLYLAPMYFANSSAMVLGGKTPLDLNKKFFDNKPIFGKGKTYKGVIFGIIIGTGASLVISILIPEISSGFSEQYVFLGFLLAAGAIAGDTVASFFKRRNNIEPGQEVLFLDQLDFVIGGMILGSFIYVPDFYEILAVGIITLIAHKLFNYIAFKTNLKRVPW